MVRSETLLTAIVTLSLGRPHFSCKEARPEGLTGAKSPNSYISVPAHAQEDNSKEGKAEEREGEIRSGKKKRE